MTLAYLFGIKQFIKNLLIKNAIFGRYLSKKSVIDK